MKGCQNIVDVIINDFQFISANLVISGKEQGFISMFPEMFCEQYFVSKRCKPSYGHVPLVPFQLFLITSLREL